MAPKGLSFCEDCRIAKQLRNLCALPMIVFQLRLVLARRKIDAEDANGSELLR
jgi:hypothetical protein